MKSIALFAATALFASGATAADLELWRLDCGEVDVHELAFFSDTFNYAGEKRTLTDSCYLIRHDQEYMLWDTGLPTALIGAKSDDTVPLVPRLKVDLPTQLSEIGVEPTDISRIGISHNHFDHVGQAASFPNATLMIGAADLAQFKATPLPFAVDPAFIKPWLEGGSKIDAISVDRDVFGDGSVTILSTPGHTPGETSLLVRLADTGPVLLSGDVAHFEEQFKNHGVPAFNYDRAETLASMDRLTGITKSLGAKLIIQHDASHINRLPAFPKSAK
ncbi:glyoxylase-like metal-dependent hydrolase (beta-lactamase superfamily II) [Pararhizobium capsulatum DSM 1112]|uniref:Glyoxylase-like metal-dependent hydrolase (Beta-lactamase superfamily II) n=1 Tax=Pararhizobium capsulatum DSM 1112 TaxID=1121113 RepID=A0ABU0BY40_9HYPH|nr:N-acyl homoserine lactonase family protein [Pararhizobium capsulatum]MDQ0322629.1 glyoxylase-like metal-dependent hydrolase (beta-lactamase superfamily II) [Pararhizobium capsulatum DSM 1112]